MKVVYVHCVSVQPGFIVNRYSVLRFDLAGPGTPGDGLGWILRVRVELRGLFDHLDLEVL